MSVLLSKQTRPGRTRFETPAMSRTLPAVPPPTPASTPAPEQSPSLSTTPVPTTPTSTGIDLYGYCAPGAPLDFVTFTYFWSLQALEGKSAKWASPSVQEQAVMKKTPLHSIMTWIKSSGGYFAVDRKPRLWNTFALGAGLIEREDQDDEKARVVVRVLKRLDRGWLRPLERYCARWPMVEPAKRSCLIHLLGRKLRRANPGVKELPFYYDTFADRDQWPPELLNPVSANKAGYVMVRLLEYQGPGIPTDYATCYYLMRLWNTVEDPNRPSEAPVLPQPNNQEVNYWTLAMEINKFGGPEELIKAPGGWNKLAFSLKLIDWESQNDTHSKSITIALRTYFKDYLCYFGIFCDHWAGIDTSLREDLVVHFMNALETTDSVLKAAPPIGVPMVKQISNSIYSRSGMPHSLPASALSYIILRTYPRIDICAYNSPGIPKDPLVFYYLYRMHSLDEGGIPPLPAWEGVVPGPNIATLRTLIDGYGGPPAFKRFPGLWSEIVFHFRLADRGERGTEKLKFMVDLLKFVEQERLIPFERFCDRWAVMDWGEKVQWRARLIEVPKCELHNAPLPLPPYPEKIPGNVLLAATTMENQMRGFYPSETFEEKLKRIRGLSLEEFAGKIGLDQRWFSVCRQWSEDDVKAMARLLTSPPSASQLIQLNSIKTVMEPQKATMSNQEGLWSSEIIKSTNQAVQDILKQINHTRANDQPRIQVPDSERRRLKQIVEDASPLAFQFYCIVALHLMIHGKRQWSEFLMRQSCLVIEQHFIFRTGGSVYIADIDEILFAQHALREELDKTRNMYMFKALNYKTAMSSKPPAGPSPLLVPPSLSAKS